MYPEAARPNTMPIKKFTPNTNPPAPPTKAAATIVATARQSLSKIRLISSTIPVTRPVIIKK